MQAEQSRIGDEQNQICEVDTGKLEDAVSRHLPMLYRRAYRFVDNSHDAEDAVQDALLSAYKHLDQFKGGAKITTWLTSIVTNSALTQLRKKSRHPHASLDESVADEQDYRVSDTLADERPSPESEYIEAELHGNLMRSVTDLPPALRRVVQLRYMDGLTTNEIARILGVPGGTVKTRVSRARSKLRRMMHEK